MGIVVGALHGASVPTSWLGGIPENLQFSGLWEVLLGEYVVRVRVRAYAARELRFFGLIPSQRLNGGLLRIVLTLVRTHDDWFVCFSLCGTHGWVG
jgi:hypothetical protein